jgi:hypothetical protein
MARNIKNIAEDLGAKLIGRVSKPSGGVLGAAKIAHEAAALSTVAGTESGLLGAMREDAELLDAIVEDAMRDRRMQTLRPRPENFAALEKMAEATGRPLNALLDEALQLLLRQWTRQQAEARQHPEDNPDNSDRKPIWERLTEVTADIPEEVWTEWPRNPEGINLETADATSPHIREKVISELGRRMSHLSETAYCAGWMHHLEIHVPELCEQAVKTGKVQPFGGTVVCPGLAARLLAMRDKLGSWVVPGIKGGYEPYLPSENA